MEKRKLFYGWYNVGIGFLIMGLTYASFTTCQGVFMIPVVQELGIARVGFNLVMTIASFGVIIGSAFAGKILEKRSIKKVVAYSNLVIGVSYFGYALAPSITVFYIIAPIFGIALAFATTIPLTVLLNSWFGSGRKGTAMSIAFAGTGVGSMVLTIVLTKLIETFGWRITYGMLGAVIIAMIVPLSLIILQNRPEDKNLTRLSDGKEKLALDTNHKDEPEYSMSQIKKMPAFWFLLIAFFAYAATNTGMVNNQIPYFTDLKLDMDVVIIIVSVVIGLISFGKVALGFICDKVGVFWGTLLGNMFWIICMGSMLAISVSSKFFLLYGISMVIGGGVGTVCPPLIIGLIFGEKNFAKIVSINTIGLALGSAIGPTLAGAIYESTGSYKMAWVVMFVAAVVITLLLGIITKTKKHVS